ncbi:MAG: hypothetical protein GY884_23145 [Proteobacteria bacterium]|nr:hypothetical protein [Pseudomonadota bacterium]
MIPNPPHGWPFVHEAADPWAGDEWLPDQGDHDNHLLIGGRLDRETHDRLDAAWLDAYFDVLRGDREFDDEELASLSDRLHLVGPRTHDRRPPKLAPFPIPDDRITDIVEEYVPDGGMMAQDRFLGPWADELPDRALVRAAGVHLAWIPLLEMEGSPALRFYNSSPKAPIPIRRAVQAVHKAPPMLWTTDWKPLLPVIDHWIPDGPVQGDIVPLDGPIEAVLARVTPTAEGWSANGAIGLPSVPPIHAVLRRLDLEMLRRRRHERRTTWEVLLRLRPEVLFRTCTTWCWMERT